MLNNKVALVTGGARGIGRAIALKLAGEGADIAILDAGSLELSEQTAEEIRALGVRAFAARCDITDYYQPTKNSSLDDIPTLVWLRENCADYGFIWRFPSDKSDVTGVMGESWHFRYVGQDAARYIMDNHLTLEEFWQQFGDSASV